MTYEPVQSQHSPRLFDQERFKRPLLAGASITQEELIRQIEVERLQQLQDSAEKLKQKLKKFGRCPICTLPQPCKHAGLNTLQFAQITEETPQSIQHQQTLTNETFHRPNQSPFNKQPPLTQGGGSNLRRQSKHAINYQGSKSNTNLHMMNQDGFVNFDNQNDDIFSKEGNLLQQLNQNGEDISAMMMPSSAGQDGVSPGPHFEQMLQQENGSMYSGVQNMNVTVGFQQNRYYQPNQMRRKQNFVRQSYEPRQNPYSILNTSQDEDFEEEFRRSLQYSANSAHKNTRAQFLKQLHLKKQFKENPALTRFSKDVIASLRDRQQKNTRRSLDVSHLNQSHFENGVRQVRVRNRRGEYETLEVEQKSRDNSHHSQLRQAEERLILIEQIAKFHEEKMKREYDKLQEELEKEAERERFEQLKEQKRVRRLEKQKKLLQEFHKGKEQERIREKQMQSELVSKIKEQKLETIKQNELIKLKLKEYYEQKARAGILQESSTILQVPPSRLQPLPSRGSQDRSLESRQNMSILSNQHPQLASLNLGSLPQPPHTSKEKYRLSQGGDLRKKRHEDFWAKQQAKQFSLITEKTRLKSQGIYNSKMKIIDVSAELTKLGFRKPQNPLNKSTLLKSKYLEHEARKHETLQYPMVKQTGQLSGRKENSGSLSNRMSNNSKENDDALDIVQGRQWNLQFGMRKQGETYQ
ncbi:hypothetical protein FGO68_gene6533 [Halteria grandinella]|uniref:Uncharacterized protein n=1 Tax=Halteria grandinella TaxID=5974 RepID=A0A8J8SX38_HALGN|nr:hypothetical protein FGO68_gene6533 [Halteria grandinella]